MLLEMVPEPFPVYPFTVAALDTCAVFFFFLSFELRMETSLLGKYFITELHPQPYANPLVLKLDSKWTLREKAEHLLTYV